MGSLRNTRRAGATLVEQAQRAHVALLANRGPGQYVTGQFVHVDLATQTDEVVDAGHPLPVRLRGGPANEVASSPELPFGALESGTGSGQDIEPLGVHRGSARRSRGDRRGGLAILRAP